MAMAGSLRGSFWGLHGPRGLKHTRALWRSGTKPFSAKNELTARTFGQRRSRKSGREKTNISIPGAALTPFGLLLGGDRHRWFFLKLDKSGGSWIQTPCRQAPSPELREKS